MGVSFAMSNAYSQKLRDRRWQEKRLRIMQRDGFQCRDCPPGQQSYNELQVHHCRYHKNPWEVEDEFLLTVCDECHKRRQELEDAAKLALAICMACSSPAGVENLADQLSTLASHNAKLEFGLPGECEFLGETRWIAHAREYPAMREHVEAVIGRVIDWKAA